MKTKQDFQHIDPDNKLIVKTIPAGTTVDAKHPYYERMKASGCLQESSKKPKPKSKTRMTNPAAE